MVVGWDTTTMWLLLALSRLLGRDYALWIDTSGMNLRGPAWREHARTAFLRWIFVGARAVLATGRPGVDALQRTGALEDRLFLFPFVLDLDEFCRVYWEQQPGATLELLS